MKTIDYGRAICYSGYRQGQSPRDEIHPSYEEIKEDLLLLVKDYDYIRMYDISDYTRLTLKVIKNEDIDLKVLLTMSLLGEISNHSCEWGGEYPVKTLAKHIAYNQDQLNQSIQLVKAYKDEILAVSAGNEAAPLWNENLVSPARILYFVNELKKHTDVPVTYCDNIHEWKDTLKDVAKAVDFISIHIYPVWEGKRIAEAIDLSVKQYNIINDLYKDKQVIITETGWPTTSNHDQILPEVANEKNQLIFNSTIKKWSQKNQVTCFFFEAFDEPWKGSHRKDDPEKHWGYYFENRQPKLIVKKTQNHSMK